MPPRLPPRAPSQTSSTPGMNDRSPLTSSARENIIHLTPQSVQNNPYSNYGGLHDPRTSSMQSLQPVESQGPNRRTLLIVYIHGFMGAETSFRSFPAHVHSLLSVTLSETHVVHTKIYPRYQSRKNISFAADAFSNWLTPRESPTTDVILIGHSLGGILAAEVALIPSHIPGSQEVYQHRLLGLIAYDTPFLGMHPGVIGTGIASLFRGAPESDKPAEEATVSEPPAVPNDPNYNPAFSNDVHLPVRSNKFERAWYFWNKHSGDLMKAAQSYVKSHLEFGGCMADYPGLKRRYDAIRVLEDVDDLGKAENADGRHLHRVRFVNYYTASTGRIKEEKPVASDDYLTTETEMQSLKAKSTDEISQQSSRVSASRLSPEERQNEEIVEKTDNLELDHDSTDAVDLQVLDPQPHDESETDTVTTATTLHDDLPPIPLEPSPPPKFDASQYEDPDALRLARKENERQIKAYDKAKKDRAKTIRDREKLIAKRERKAQQEQEKIDKAAMQEEQRRHDDNLLRQATLNPEHQDRQMREDAKQQPTAPDKPKKDRVFCMLPGTDRQGRRDQTWIRVYMEGMDEVVAHTSLFFVSDAYAKLVGDTAERIEQWVNDDATTRLILSEQG